MLYPKRATTMIFFDVARDGRIASMHATTISQPPQDTRMQQSNIIYAVGCKDDSNKHYRLQGWRQPAYLSMSYCKERRQQTMVDCNKGGRAKQQPTKLCVALQEQARTPRNIKIVDTMMMPYIMSQEAMLMATTINCNKRVRSCLWQPPFFINVDQPHQRLQRREAPAIRLTATPRHNIDDAKIILYFHIARSNDNNKQMWGKNMTTPMQQSHVHVIIRGMQRWPYHNTCWPAAQVCQGRVQWVRQRQCVHLQRRVRCQRLVHWLRRSHRVCHQGQVWQVLQGGCIRRGGPEQTFLPKKAMTNPWPRMATRLGTAMSPSP